MRLEAGHSGNQRADPGRDRDDEDVVDNQRVSGEQSGAGPEIFARDRVGTASSRISANGLAVGDIDDDRERDDTKADGDHILDAECPERDQKGERGLRAVSRGAERIEAEHSDAGQRAEALFCVFVVNVGNELDTGREGEFGRTAGP